jgi:hypothetical protein
VRARARAVAWCVVASAMGCGSPPPAPPTAVIDAQPAAVCYRDAFATTVRLDGSCSAEALELVPSSAGECTAPPLAFAWTFAGAETVVAFDDGPHVELKTAGDRPLHVTLTVRAAHGGEASTLRTIAITVPDKCPGPCCP